MVKGVNLKSWKFAYTDGENGPYIDHSVGGVLLESQCDCPFCYSENSVLLCAGDVGDGNIIAKEWSCGACGNAGHIIGSFGESEISGDNQDMWLHLPSCVVLETK